MNHDSTIKDLTAQTEVSAISFIFSSPPRIVTWTLALTVVALLGSGLYYSRLFAIGLHYAFLEQELEERIETYQQGSDTLEEDLAKNPRFKVFFTSENALVQTLVTLLVEVRNRKWKSARLCAERGVFHSSLLQRNIKENLDEASKLEDLLRTTTEEIALLEPKQAQRGVQAQRIEDNDAEHKDKLQLHQLKHSSRETQESLKSYQRATLGTLSNALFQLILTKENPQVPKVYQWVRHVLQKHSRISVPPLDT